MPPSRENKPLVLVSSKRSSISFGRKESISYHQKNGFNQYSLPFSGFLLLGLSPSQKPQNILSPRHHQCVLNTTSPPAGLEIAPSSRPCPGRGEPGNSHLMKGQSGSSYNVTWVWMERRQETQDSKITAWGFYSRVCFKGMDVYLGTCGGHQRRVRRLRPLGNGQSKERHNKPGKTSYLSLECFFFTQSHEQI